MKLKLVSAYLLITVLLLLCASCGMNVPAIENYEWKMRSVMHVENDQLIMDASDEASAAHPQAKLVDMRLVAKDGKITITDATNNKTYEGTYTVSGKNPKGTDYHVTLDGIEGYATVAMTTYADGREEPTLPINLGEYSLYFYSE